MELNGLMDNNPPHLLLDYMKTSLFRFLSICNISPAIPISLWLLSLS